MIMVSFVFQHISMADIWIDDNINIVSDNSASYDMYLGYFSFNHDSISVGGLPNAGIGSTVTSVDLLHYDSGFHLQTGIAPSPGNQWSIPMALESLAGCVLYDSDLQVIGTYLSVLDSYVYTKTDGPYTIGQGQSISLDSIGNFIPSGFGWLPYFDPLSSNNVGGGMWSIEGQGVPQNVSYEYLTTQLGLAEGTYDLLVEKSYVEEGMDYLEFWGYDTTTITIVPEPATILIFLGSLPLIRRRR